jgi:hypothetical protein
MNVDDVAEEALSIHLVNNGPYFWDLEAVWKNGQKVTYTMVPRSANVLVPGEVPVVEEIPGTDVTFNLPVGQRKWIHVPLPDDGGGLDAEFASFQAMQTFGV